MSKVGTKVGDPEITTSRVEAEEPIAVDIFADLSQSSIQLEKSENPLASATISSNDLEVDPITKAIRTQILGEQRKLIGKYLIEKESEERGKLHQEAISGLSEEEKLTLQKEFEETEKRARADHEAIFKSPELFREYCDIEENQEKINQALKNASLKKALEGVEINGYRDIHERFDSAKYPGGFKTMSWQDSKSDAPNVREQIVRGANGEELATLTETTHTNTPPITVQKSDGTVVEVKSHRRITLPLELEEGKGSMHVSLVAKDVNGHNVAASKAVYYTAHYAVDPKSGKSVLSEISHPEPLKYLGNGADALAYIEQDGQILTLMVTREEVLEHKREVARNHGHSVDISRSIERSSDQISVDTPSQQKLERQQETIVSRKVSKFLEQQKEFSAKSYLAAENKQDFLKNMLNSKLLPPDQLTALEDIIKNGGKAAAAEVMDVVAGSKYATNLTRQLLQGEHKREVLAVLAKTEVGKKLLIDTYVAASETERKDISGLVNSTLTQEEQTELTGRFMDSVVQPGKITIVTELKKSTVGTGVLTEVVARSSTTGTEQTIKEVEKPIAPAPIKKIESAQLGSPQAPKTVIEQAEAIKVALKNPKKLDAPKKPLTPERITEIAKNLSTELDPKLSPKELNSLIDKRLLESDMSPDQQIRMLTELNKFEAEKREKHILSATPFNKEKDAAIRTSSPTERKKDKTGAEKPGQFKEEITVVGKTGGVKVQGLITEKIAQVKLQQQVTAAQPKLRSTNKRSTMSQIL